MTTELEKANRDLNNLEEQREALFSRAKLLSKQRDQIAFAALTAGDKPAKAKLSEINAEDTGLAANIASVEAALTVARANLNTAKAAEAQAADRTNALKLRDKLAKFRELGAVLDDCFTDFKSAGFEQKQVLDDIHNLGQPTPSAQQYRVLCEVALKTAVQGTPFWSQDFPAMAPNQRKTFKSIVDAWCEVIEANIAARLGEQKKDAA
jgi:chromosome segregation ATPase